MNPLFNANRLKLGVFMFNGVGQLLWDLPPREVTWPATLRIAKLADDAGFEALVPYARWKGVPRPEPLPFVPHDVFEPFTWAAGLAQATQHSAIFATTHVPMMHPIVVAKMATTIDHIADGRFALNVVAGWNGPEFTMFGEDLKPHDDRYAQAAEWMTVLRRLWTERDFDYSGENYRIVAGESFPKRLQHPHPPIMNAGGSATGRAFAAEFADLCFVMLAGDGDMDLAREQIASYRTLARERFGREIAIWTNATVILADTRDAAEAEVRFLDAHRNDVAAQALLATRAAGARTLTLESGRELRPASLDASTIVGDAHDVAARLRELSEAGVDGVVLVARDFADTLTRFTRTVLPLLERDGIRAPFC